MSFDTDEKSVSDGRPREFFEITHGTTTYRVASGQRDIEYNGAKFVATPSARINVQIDTLTAEKQFSISLPISHPLVTRWFQQLSPPQFVTVTVRRLQLTSGEVEQVWFGDVTSMAIDRHEAKLPIPSLIGRLMQRLIPLVLVDARCGAVLYDSWCGIDRAANTYAGHVTFVDGRDVHVAFDVAYPAGDGWANLGQLIHIASGEVALVVDHVGLDVILKAPIVGMRVGDNITVCRGCKKDIPTCRDTFANVVNFVNLPHRPTTNPFFPTGTGIGDSR